MTDRENDRDSVPSSFEEAGLPDLEDGSPQQRWARDPQEAPLPGDEPVAADAYGTTYREMNDGEPLALKLDREEPDVSADTDDAPADATAGGEAGAPGSPVGRLVAEGDDGVEDTEKQELGRDVGTDLGGASAEEAAMHVDGG